MYRRASVFNESQNHFQSSGSAASFWGCVVAEDEEKRFFLSWLRPCAGLGSLDCGFSLLYLLASREREKKVREVCAVRRVMKPFAVI